MAIKESNKLIQVKVNNVVYRYLCKYSELFGVSISSYCNMAIIDRILNSKCLESIKEKEQNEKTKI